MDGLVNERKKEGKKERKKERNRPAKSRPVLAYYTFCQVDQWVEWPTRKTERQTETKTERKKT